MIARLEFPEGVPFASPDVLADRAALAAMVMGIIVENSADFTFPDPGVYDVTPKIWTRHLHEHELTVLDNGRGLYRMIPRSNDVGVYDGRTDNPLQFRPGGSSTHLGPEEPIVLITGNHPRRAGLQLFGLVSYFPNS